MNSFELNKIMGAVLGTLLFVMGVGFLAEAIYHPIEDRGPGYALPEPEVAEGGEAAPAEAAVPLGTLLASATAEAGAAAARRCQSCHTFEEGAGNRTGPELYNVVDRAIGSFPDYAYSPALLDHGAAGETWTYEALDAFLTNPQQFAPGSKMNLVVGSPEDRANILAYLQSLSASPVPFPEPEAAPAAEGEAPAEGGEALPADEGAVDVPEGEDVVEPAVPGETESVVSTPTETEGDSTVQGTATGSGTPAAVEDETAPQASGPTEDAPAEPATPTATTEPAAPPAPVETPAETAPAQ